MKVRFCKMSMLYGVIILLIGFCFTNSIIGKNVEKEETPIFQISKTSQMVVSSSGLHHDRSHEICADSSGNTYITGNFDGPAKFGPFDLNCKDMADIFVAKLDSNGNWLWAVSAGGNFSDNSNGICVDSNNNIYITGYFSQTANFGSRVLTCNGADDIYVAKLDSNGNWLWTVSAGDVGFDEASGICADSNNNIYVTGHFSDSVNFGPYLVTSNGEADIFIAKLDTNGNWLWALGAGASEYDYGYDICVDFGFTYVTGKFSGTANFGPGSLTSMGLHDIFIAKLDTNGNWQWARSAGGTRGDNGYGICLTSTGSACITGFYEDTAYFGSHVLNSEGYNDFFIAKLNINGNWLWARSAGGVSSDKAFDICIDTSGNIYASGVFSSTASFGSTVLTAVGNSDIFVAKLSFSGDWTWVKQAGGNDFETCTGVCVDSSGNVYITGCFQITAEFGSHILTSKGGDDIYVAKLDTNGNWQWAGSAGGGRPKDGQRIFTLRNLLLSHIFDSYPHFQKILKIFFRNQN